MLIQLPWKEWNASILSNSYLMVFIVGLLLIPVNLLRDMTSLSWSSMLGNISIISCLFIVLMYK